MVAAVGHDEQGAAAGKGAPQFGHGGRDVGHVVEHVRREHTSPTTTPAPGAADRASFAMPGERSRPVIRTPAGSRRRYSPGPQPTSRTRRPGSHDTWPSTDAKKSERGRCHA